MRYAIQITGSPFRSPGSATGYQFIKAALRKGHDIVRVFFYGDGVFNAAPAPENRHWSELASAHGVDLVVCISAAQRRRLIDPGLEIDEEGSIIAESLTAGFRIAGLSLWVEACLTADRVMSFE